MRVDLSEPECRNCYHCRASGIFPTQASELSNVIGSSLVSSGTVQALGDDSAAVGSTSTSSPLQALRDDSGIFPAQASKLSNVIGSSPVSSGTVQALGDDSAAVGSTSTSSPLQALRDDSGIFPAQASKLSNVIGSSPVSSGTVQALEDDSAAAGSTSTSSPLQALRDDSGIFPTQASKLSNVIGSSPVSSGTVQALGDDSAAVGSTSTTSPLQALRDDSGIFPTQASKLSNVIGSSPVSSGTVQALGDDSAAVGSTSTSSKLQALRDDSAAVGLISTSSPVQTSSPNFFESPLPSITSISSGLAQSPACNLFENCAFESLSHRPAFQSPVQDPFGCFASATSRSPLHSSSPFGFAPAVTSVSSAPTQAFGPTASGFGTLFGKSVAFARPDIGFSPASSSSTYTVVFGTTPASVSSPFGPIQASTSTFLPFGSVPAPPSGGPSFFGPAKDMPWGTNSFSTGCGIERVRSDVGVFPASSSSTTTVGFGTTPASVSSPFGTIQASTSTFLPFGSVPASSLWNSVFGSPPASSSSNPFRLNPSTNASVSSPFGFSPSVTSVSSALAQAFGPTASGFGTFAAPTSSRFASMKAPVQAPFGPAAPALFGCPPKQGSRCPGYAPTPDRQTNKGDIYISISASNPYLDKSHEELRWEDYKQGFKGGSFSSAHASPIGSGPKAVFSPSIFASPSVPDHSQKTNFATTQGNFSGPVGCGFSPAAGSGATTFPSGGFSQPNAPSASHDWSRRPELKKVVGFPPFGQPNALFTGGGTHFPSSFSSFSTSFPAVSSSVQRPHEAAAVSSPPFGCTACGATSSSSASPNFTFNGATASPSAAISLPVLFYPTSGFGTSSAAQGTTPAPVQGYILLPLAAMSLQ